MPKKEPKTRAGSPVISTCQIPQLTRFEDQQIQPKVFEIEEDEDEEDLTQFTTLKGKEKALSTPSLTVSSPDPLSMPTPLAKVVSTRSSGR